MTREEREAAIAYIKGYRKLDEDLHNAAPKDSISYYATDKCLKYWDMAISALEQNERAEEWYKLFVEKFESCEDVISREAVMGLVAREHDEWDDLYIDIAKLPSVTPIRPKGHWIYLENGFELGVRVKCSECGQVFITGDDVSRNFCSNCGAKMESEV